MRNTLIFTVYALLSCFTACGGVTTDSLPDSSSQNEGADASTGDASQSRDGGSVHDASISSDASTALDSGVTPAKDSGLPPPPPPSTTCGSVGQDCCDTGDDCVPGAVCSDDVNGCIACGKPGQACCDNDVCQSGSACATLDDDHRCYVASTSVAGGTCDITHTCPLGTTCGGGYCLQCGGFGQECCAGVLCSSGLACKDSLCK